MAHNYNNLVSTLKLVRKHRPFAENDNLPKICQPEDHVEVSSPRSSSSSEMDNGAMIAADEENSIRYHEERKDTAKMADIFGD